MKRAVLPTLALLFVTAVAGCNGGPEVEWSPPAGYAGMVNPKGQTVILVIDRSLSMRTTDPGNFNIAGAQIAVSILEDEDNVGIVTFAAKAQVVAPTQSLKSHDVRAELRQKLEAIEMTGMATDFTQGLGMAKALLDPLKLVKERVSVVFLTDGSHSVFDTKEYIPELIDTIKAKGWKVFSIAFGGQIGKEDEKGLLQEMALKTKGAYFKIRRPRDLPGAFIQIFSQIKDFMTYKGKGDLVVQPMLKRLLFLMTKRRPSDSFRRILRDGQDLDLVAEKAFHYPEAPASGGRLSRFEIVSFSRHVPPQGFPHARVSAQPDHGG
jgi:methylmalonyl-CoA mutase cobalamin-binding subunit